MPTSTYSLDSSLQKQDSDIFGIDGYLIDEHTATHSINAYNTREKSDSSLSINAVVSRVGNKTLSINAVLGEKIAYFNINARLFTTLDGGNTLTLWYANKDPQEVADTAMYITQFEDLDSNNWKHVKSVDFIGDYGNNDINMAFSFTPNYSVWSSYMTITPNDFPDQAARFYNQGQGRRMAFKVKFVGDSQINHEAIEVSYNIRTQ